MKINGKATKAKQFAYDGCHKIYLLEDENDLSESKDCGYEILPVSILEKTFRNSCGLQFVANWKLEKDYVEQGEADVLFEA